MAFTITDNSPRAQYTASAAQTVFSVPFEWRANSDLKVYANEILKTLNVDYTLTGAQTTGGGTLTFTVGRSAGDTVTIIGDMPVARTSDEYSAGGQLPAAVLEASFDDVTMKMKQLERDIGRSLRLSAQDSSAAGAFELTTVANRANKVLRFNSLGVPEFAVDIGTTTLSRGVIGALLYPQTTAEVAVAVTPTDYSYWEGHVSRYGALQSPANASAAFQAAIDVANAHGTSAGGLVYVPTGAWLVNVTMKSGVTIYGDGNSTKIGPFANGPVFTTASGADVVRLGWQDLFIDGNPAFAINDGILLSVGASKSIDTISLARVRIANCGRYGLRTETNSYVQSLKIDHSKITDNARAGLSTSGRLLETVLTGTFVVGNGGAAGVYANCEFLSDSGSANRLIWNGGGINAITSMQVAIPQIGLHLQHTQQVELHLDLESADPMLSITGNLTQNIEVSVCNFGSNITGTRMIQIDDGEGIVIDNNAFNCTVAYTNAILSSTAINRVSKLDITDTNRFSSNITTPVSTINTLTIAAGVAYAYRRVMRLDTEASAATDDLDYIYDNSGTASTKGLVDGQRITLSTANSGRDVVIKHNIGNIFLRSAADFTMGTTDALYALEWNNQRQKWYDV